MSQVDFTALTQNSKIDSCGRVNVTGWDKQFGKRWVKFLEFEKTQDLIKSTCSRVKVPVKDLIKTTKGRNGSTYIHKILATAYAEWLNSDFSVFVKETFLRVAEGDSDLAADMMIRDHNKGRVERAKQRVLCSETNKQTMALAQDWGTPYAQVHNDRYRGLYEMDARQLRESGNLEKNETPLNALSVYDLTLNSLANQQAKMANNPQSMTRIASGLRRMHKENVGKDLEPTWEEKRLRPSQARAIAFSPEYQTELPIL